MRRSTTLLSVTLLLILGMIGTASAGEVSDSSVTRSYGVSTEVTLWPRSNEVPFGQWTKLAGTAFEESGVPVEGDQITLEYWDGSTWRFIAWEEPDKNGYYQKWIYTEQSPRRYRAMHTNGTVSNETTVTLTDNISAWNNYRPKTRYGQWTKVHGKYGGPDGSYSNATLYLQSGYDEGFGHYHWQWAATVKTDANGYYSYWFQNYSSSIYRLGTEGSQLLSNMVPKTGSTSSIWTNSRVHGVFRDGYGDPITGQWVYLQKWDGSKWIWAGSAKTSSTGYVKFNPYQSAIYRLATWGSAVISSEVQYTNPAINQQLTSVELSTEVQTHEDYIMLVTKALDQYGDPIKGAAVASNWDFPEQIRTMRDVTNFDGVTGMFQDISDLPDDWDILVDVGVTYKGKAMYETRGFARITN